MSMQKTRRDVRGPLRNAAIDLIWERNWKLSDFLRFFQENWDELARLVEEGKEKDRREWEEAIRKQKEWEEELRECMRGANVFDSGLATEQARQARIAELKVTLQRTHPDKGQPDPIAFNVAKRELDRLRAGKR